MRETLSAFCARTGRDALLREWDGERNAPLTPDSVSCNSHERVWWRCEKGHAWQTLLYTRTGSGTGCPYCAGRRPWPGENDLASQRPDLAAQWHPTKNGDLTPEQVTAGSHRMVWWVCEKGHAWQTMVKSRGFNHAGCPVCANQVVIPGQNDLASQFPKVAKQWHPTKNGDLTPEQVGSGTHRRVWWRCKKGHEWVADINTRTRKNAGCPYCAGKRVLPGETDLVTLFPEVAAQWDTARNGGLSPQSMPPYSNKKVWWKCPQGHEYQAVVAARTRTGGGCPYCAGKKVLVGFNDLATTCPEIAAQWHPTLNGALTPQMFTYGSMRHVWWLCPEGHVWRAPISRRAGKQRSGCPLCARTVRRTRRRYYDSILAEVQTVHPANGPNSHEPMIPRRATPDRRKQ